MTAPRIGTQGRPPDDAALVARLRSGDERAFEEVVRTHGGRLLAVARRVLRDEEEAKDALQDAFASAFRGVGAFSGRSSLGTWLHRIVVNAALMRLRSRGRLAEEPLDDLLPKFLDDGHHAEPPVSWGRQPDDDHEREERRRLVRRCIDALPDSHRTVLLLRDVEEMDTGEVATLLGLTENAVKLRLHRARQALRTLLDPTLRGEAP